MDVDLETLSIAVSPNPVESPAQVRVSSTVAQRVQLRLVDATGRRLALLLDAEMVAGEERWLALDLAAIEDAGAAVLWIEAIGDAARTSRRLITVR